MSGRRWTPKGAVARSKKNIAGAVERLRAVALEWRDVDEGLVRLGANVRNCPHTTCKPL